MCSRGVGAHACVGVFLCVCAHTVRVPVIVMSAYPTDRLLRTRRLTDLTQPIRIAVTSQLQWTSSPILANNSTVRACKGQDVELDWRFSSLPEEHTQTVEWYHSHENGKVVAPSLGWRFSNCPEEHTQTVKWYYSHGNGKLIYVFAHS